MADLNNPKNKINSNHSGVYQGNDGQLHPSHLSETPDGTVHHQEIRNPDGSIRTNTVVEPNTNPVNYQDGYVHGRSSERSLQEQNKEVRANNNAARGLLLGIALTSLVGLAAAASFLLNQRNEPPVYNTVVPVPAKPQPNTNNTKVIERTTETQVPATSASPSQPTTIVVPGTSQQPSTTAPQGTAPQPASAQPRTQAPTSTVAPRSTTPQTAPAQSRTQAPAQSQQAPASSTIPQSAPNTTQQPSITAPQTTTGQSQSQSQPATGSTGQSTGNTGNTGSTGSTGTGTSSGSSAP